MSIDSGSYDQATLLRRMQIAQAMMQPKKITHWAEGLSNLANTAVGAYDLAKIDAENKQSKYGDSAALAAQLGLPAPSSPSQSTSGAAKIASLLGFDFPGNSGPSVSPSSAAVASDVPQQAVPAGPAANPMGNRVAAAMSAGPTVPNDSNAMPGQAGMNLKLADASQDFIQDNPGTSMSSGFRSNADQARLYADRSNNPNPVARPGTSNHERGMAVDIAGMTPEQRAALPQYGLAQPVANDPPHVELARSAKTDAVATAMGNHPAALPVNAQATQGFAIPGQPAKPDVAGALSSPPVQGGILASATPQQKAMIAAGLNARPGSAAHTLAMSTVQAVMKQQMQQNDPAHQLDMQLKQGQLSKLKDDIENRGATSDTKNYDFYAKQERDAGRTPLSFNDFQLSLKKAGTATTTINNTVNPILKGVGDRFNEDMDTARASIPQINGIFEARKALDQGAITGAGADQKLFLGKVANLFGLGGDAASNTETLRSAVGNSVLAKAKTLGANPSNADREYIEKIMGGSINLEESSMRRLLDIQEKWARQAIQRANANGQKILAAQPEELKNISPLLTVAEPGSYEEFLKSSPIQQQRPAGAVRRYNPQTGKIE